MDQKYNTEEGFSLTEVLIVIVIIGILVLLALPRFSSVVTKAKETEAKIMLAHLHSLQQAYYFENDMYTSNLAQLGFDQNKLVADGGTARYKIEIKKADGLSYSAVATAVVDFDKDGIFNEWTVDQNGQPVQTIPD